MKNNVRPCQDFVTELGQIVKPIRPGGGGAQRPE